MSRSSIRLLLPWRVVPWLSALIKSFAAVASLTAATGVVFLPAEMARLADHQRVFIGYCEPAVDGEKFVSLVRTFQKELFVGDQRRVVLHDLGHGTATVFGVVPVSDVASFAASPDGTKLYLGAQDGSISALNLVGRWDCVRRLGRHIHRFPSRMLCVDDKTLLSIDNDGLYAWDLEDWRLRWCRLDGGIGNVAISADSRTLVCSRGTREHAQLWELDLESGKDVRPLLSGPTWQELRFSPDGHHLAGLGWDGSIQLLRRTADGKSWIEEGPAALKQNSHRLAPTFRPDSNVVVLGHPEGNRMILWDLERDEVLGELGPTDDVVIGSRFIAKDELLSWGANGAFRVWDVTLRKTIRRGTIPELDP